MKKIFALLLVVSLAFAFVACKPDDNKCTDHVDENYDGVCDNEGCGAAVEVDVMTYAEYVAANIDDFVVIEAYVQAHQSWWDNKITVYLADEDGAYFAYEMACSEEDAAKLTPGTKLRVYGTKAEWAGEVEIVDCAFHILEADPYVAEAKDLTAKLGTDEMINYQNQLAKFTDMTVVSIAYKNGEPGDDVYLTLSKDGANYDFCLEIYLTGSNTEVYQLVSRGMIAEGDVIDVECFVYWYNGINPHVVGISNINE